MAGGSRAAVVTKRSALGVALAFAAIYVIWGSTYLAIKFAIDTVPPFMMAGVRFSLAGLVMYIALRWRGTPAPRLEHWRSATIVGGLLLLCANGVICWAELKIPSGITALLVATVPLWMITLDWLFFNGPRPTLIIAIGLACGLLGMYTLVSRSTSFSEAIYLPGALGVLFACGSWSVGSLYSRRAPLPKSLVLATAMELFCGGVLLLVASAIMGEWAHVQPAAISLKSVISVVYLITFGSIVAFTAFVYLLDSVSPAAVSTYAFVNPIVALGLGVMFGQERLDSRAWIASALIIVAVVLVTLRRSRPALSVATVANTTPATATVAASTTQTHDFDPVQTLTCSASADSCPAGEPEASPRA